MVELALSRFDRATLLFWRITNVVGWSALAVYLAVVGHQLLLGSAIEAAGYRRNEEVWLAPSVRSLVELAVTRILALALTSAVIAWFVARKVAARPLLMTLVAGVTYVALVLVLFEHNRGWAGYLFGAETNHDGLPLFIPNEPPRVIAHDIAIGLTIPLSWWFARRSLGRARLPA